MNKTPNLLTHPLCRALSLLVALAISGSILILPQLLTSDGQTQHGLLAILMLGVSICFIHGVGYVPESRIFNWLFSPLIGWTLLGFASFALWG